MRNLIAITVALVAASSASAATLTLDLDKSSYQVGEDIIVTATVVTDGTEYLTPFAGYGLGIEWDPAVASVKNAGVLFPNGHSTQVVTAGPGTGGSALTYDGGTPIEFHWAERQCADPGGCQIVAQVKDFTAGTLDVQTLVGTLVLQAVATGALAETIATVQMNLSTDIGLVQIGSNWGGAVVVPEPTTGALLALGLLGIAGARRL